MNGYKKLYDHKVLVMFSIILLFIHYMVVEKQLESKVPKHSYMRGKKGTYVEIHFLAKKFKTYFVMIHPSFHDDTSKFKTRMSQGLHLHGLDLLYM